MSIDKKLLGKTDLLATRLAFGAMELRAPEHHRQANEILNTVLDCGINFIDTSQDYGTSEELIGNYISHRRSEYYIATKCGCDISGTGRGNAHIFTQEHITKNLEDSLRKLKTDYIDFWQLHCVTPTDLPGGANDDIIQTMFDMKRAGKVRYIGVSFRGGKVTDACYPLQNQEDFAVEMAKWGVFDGFQMVYGALTRTSEKTMNEMKELGTGIIARGILKKYFPYYNEIVSHAKLHELYEQGESESDFLIRFAMNINSVDTMIVGSSNPNHIKANTKAAEKGMLPHDVFEEAVRRLDSATTLNLES